MNDDTDGAGCQSSARSRLTRNHPGAASDLPKSTKPPRRHRMQATAQAPLGADLDLVRGAGDRGRRIRAIVGASSGNLVEWYDFYAYAFTSIYFAACLLPGRRSDHPADVDRRHLRGRLLHASPGRLAVRLDRRPARAQELDGDLGADDVRRLADDRRAADLCQHRCAGAGAAAGGPAGPGAVGGRRVRHGRDLHERDRRPGPSRLLFIVPVRDPDRRAAAGAAGRWPCCSFC